MKQTARFLGAASFFLPLTLYLATICPTVHLGDSGELNLAAATLGIPHVPGYPLLATIAHFFCRLPLGNGAFRGNLFSAVSGALACFLLYRLLLWKFKRPVPAFALAMALAGSFTLWGQSLKIRAYPLNTCFAVGTIFLTLLWRQNHDRRILFLLAFLFGLGLCNHEILLVTATVPFVAMIADIRKLRYTDVLIACVLGVIGLSVYGYLPLRAAADPVLNWGDPRTLDRFLDVILQRQYSGKMLNADWGPKLAMTGIIFRSFLDEFRIPLALAGLFGIASAWRRDRVLLIGLVCLILTNTALRINYIGDHEFHQVLRYMISSHAAFLIIAAFPVNNLFEAVEQARSSGGFRRMLAASLAALFALPPILAHGAKNDLSNHRVGYDFIQAALLFPEPDYALAVGGDNDIFPLWYLQRFERFREDVVAIPTQGFRAPWLAEQIAARLPEGMTEARIRYVDIPFDSRFYSTLDRLNKAGRPVYTLFDTIGNDIGAAAMQDLAERFSLSPCGMAFRFGATPSHCDPLSPLWNRYALDRMTDPYLYRDFHTASLLDNVATLLTRRGGQLAGQQRWKEAVDALSTAARVLPDDPAAQIALANTLARAGRPDAALDIYDRLLQEHPDDQIIKHNRLLIWDILHPEEKP